MAVALASRFWRLGCPKIYHEVATRLYDRLLREVRADTVLVGVCYASQLFPEIPMQEHDVAMDYVVTEQAVYSGIGRT
ncbi:5-formyltetrahydrofolate cyclo-ligase [Thiolapillus sp.]|uniref:5-formyltetrahydrofolate cyclo-ligase n=1 Tax=Thiolapillus sp. TaxID=2017437 RepID=UPI003AF77FA7